MGNYGANCVGDHLKAVTARKNKELVIDTNIVASTMICDACMIQRQPRWKSVQMLGGKPGVTIRK